MGAIAEALLSWEDPSPTAIGLVRAAIRQEPDENARYNMAHLLGKHLATFSDNRLALKDRLRFEQSKRIRRHVAEMLAAAN